MHKIEILFMELFKRELTRNQRTQHTEEFKMKLIKRDFTTV